ncbi:MAG TPA: alpha/beta hydrolase [Minicystis sp.]|nr:alpha/beta hydrolase [Minicystis sp.]
MTIETAEDRPATRRHADAPAWLPTLHRKRAVASDGTGIAYEIVGEGERVLMFANGLGGRLYAIEPVVEAFFRDYRIITWDYRGLFESDSPSSLRRLAVAHHVEDASTILDAEGVGRAVLVGWSMGVQVMLDLAASRPGLAAGLVLMNGTYGHVFSTGFQPLFTVPFLPRRLHAVVEYLRARPDASHRIAQIARLTELPTTLLIALTAGRRARQLQPILRRYYADVLGPSFPNFLRLFQELDAHSVFHLLPEIDAPTLVVSGALDFLTPAFQSAQIAARMPDARHLRLRRASHFALHERPDEVLRAMRGFLDERVRW